MKYVTRGEKMEVTDSIKEYLVEKLSRIDKYFDNPDSVEAKIVFIVRGREHKVEVTIPYKNFWIRSEVSHSDMYAAIDLAVDKLERQFRKYKTKLTSKKKSKEIINEIEDFFEETNETIVRRKEIFLKPIDEEEAIIQMELSNHDFYIFKDSTDDKVTVLYKRKDGNYGIIKAN